MNIETFFDPATFTLTYVVFDPTTRDAVVIDPVLDYDVLSSQTSTASVARVEGFLKQHQLKLHYVLETHAHADHLSGSQYLKRRFGASVAIGARIVLSSTPSNPKPPDAESSRSSRERPPPKYMSE